MLLTDEQKAHVIDVLLFSWSDSPAGRKVTFLLRDDGEEHPFKHLKAGPKYGQRMALSVALISDDETEQPMPAEEEKRPPGPAFDTPQDYQTKADALAQDVADPHHYSRQAAMRCDQELFYRFLVNSYEHFIQALWEDAGRETHSSDIAAQAVRSICRVQSRAEFDSDPEAAKRWRGLMAQYDEYRGRA